MEWLIFAYTLALALNISWAKTSRWIWVLTGKLRFIQAAPASSWLTAHPLRCLTLTGHDSSLGSWRSSGRSRGNASVAHGTSHRSLQTWCAQHRMWNTCLQGERRLVLWERWQGVCPSWWEESFWGREATLLISCLWNMSSEELTDPFTQLCNRF